MKALSGVSRVLCFIVYIVIAVSLLIAAPVLLGYRPMVVLSGSMESAFPVGSIIYYKAAKFEDIKVGNPITFNLGDNELATHRVVAVNEEDQSFTTKGDNNPSEDPNPVSYSRVVGKTTDFAIPFAGAFINYIQNWYMIAIMGVILLAGMVLEPDNKKAKKAKAVYPGGGTAMPPSDIPYPAFAGNAMYARQYGAQQAGYWPNQQAYPVNPQYPASAMNARQYGGQQYGAQQYGAQQGEMNWPNPQAYPINPQYAGGAMDAQQYGEQQYGTQQYGAQQGEMNWPNQQAYPVNPQYAGGAMDAQQYGAQQYGAQQYGGQQYEINWPNPQAYPVNPQYPASAMDAQQYGTQQYGVQQSEMNWQNQQAYPTNPPYPASAMDAQQYGAQQYGVQQGEMNWQNQQAYPVNPQYPANAMDAQQYGAQQYGGQQYEMNWPNPQAAPNGGYGRDATHGFEPIEPQGSRFYTQGGALNL